MYYIKKDLKVHFCNLAPSLDDSVFAEPDMFRSERSEGAFGMGLPRGGKSRC